MIVMFRNLKSSMFRGVTKWYQSKVLSNIKDLATLGYTVRMLEGEISMIEVYSMCLCAKLRVLFVGEGI